jgi:hypothetical protein
VTFFFVLAGTKIPRVRKKMPPSTTTAPTAPAMIRLRETFDRSVVFLVAAGWRWRRP